MKSLLRPISLAVAVCASTLAQADTLVDIYELALKNDATLKAAEATYRTNLETEKLSFSTLLPQISASAEYSESDSEEFSNSTISVPRDVDSESDSTTLSLSLTQTLFDLSAWFNFRQGKEVTKQAEAQLAADQQNLIVRVAEAYFNVLRTQDNLEAAKAEERATKRQLEQTQQRFDVGLIAITDVHEARAVYDATVVQRLTDEGNLGTSYEALGVLTGQEHNNLWLLNKDFPVINPDPIARDEWVNFALKHNNSLKAALYGAEAARRNATSKKMQHAPTITGFYNYRDTDQDGNNFNNRADPTITDPNAPFESQSEGYNFGIRLNVPIYSGGQISASRRQAYEQYNTSQQRKIETQRNVVQTVRASHITVSTDVQRVKARQQAIVSTSSALDATQAGYEVGTRNIVDVLQAQRNLFSSIRDYSNSRYDYVINMLSLKQAAGTLTPQDIYEIHKWMVQPDSPTANQYQEYLRN